ncbi:hypothetical protein RJ41_09745 [Alteromonas marina]|uniref:Uncharacterized protein n=1 Tax=Alteromonas marina TaxID=203795 RepID=A0A0B3Z513_9ALTE|nr:hypothetical protein RJ41_09745 [Alteromonas marina]
MQAVRGAPHPVIYHVAGDQWKGSLIRTKRQFIFIETKFSFCDPHHIWLKGIENINNVGATVKRG